VRCKQVTEKLAEYQLGALDEAEAAAVAEHVAQCARCRAELAALERTAELLEPLEPATPPRDLWAGVKRRMRPRRATAWDALAMRWRPALAVGVALLVLASGLAWLALRTAECAAAGRAETSRGRTPSSRGTTEHVWVREGRCWVGR